MTEAKAHAAPAPSMFQKIKTTLSSTGVQIPIAVVLALVLGIILNEVVGADNIPKEAKTLLALPGDVWLRALNAIVVPLILSSIVQSMQNLKKMGGGSKLATIGISYFMVSTFIAMFIAVAFCYLIMVPNLKPLDMDKLKSIVSDAGEMIKDQKVMGIMDRLVATVVGLLPSNPIKAMADTDLLAVLTMGIVIGLLIKDTEEKPSLFMKFFYELDYIVAMIVTFLVKISPIGIFSMILPAVMANKIMELMSFLGWYIITLFAALAFHYFVFYPLVYFVFIRQNPFKFLFGFTPAAMTAVGVSSSAAALPTMLKCCHAMGIHPDIYKFLVPLGVTINPDGAAMAFMCAMFFMAYGSGRTLGPIDVVLLIITDFLACMGAPPIPAAGLLFMVMMMNAINLPMNPIFSLVAAFDWLTDRPATAVNVVGDAFGCALAQKYGLGLPIDPSVNREYDMEHQGENVTKEKAK